jgi:CRP-like cAMP-binding protein
MSGLNQPDQALKVISKLTDFANLDQDTLMAIASICYWRNYQAGEVVFIEGELSGGIYIVEEGWLRSVKISPAGREQVVRYVGAGEVFNELSVFAGGMNLITVECLEPARVWIIQREELLILINQYPDLCKVIIHNLAKRLLHLISLVEDLSLRSVESRLAKLLLENAEGNIVNRKRWTTQAEMAARLGTVLDVLNRVLRGLVDEGIIHVDRFQIKILNRQALINKVE